MMSATPAVRFSKTLDELLCQISEIVQELNLEGLCSTHSAAVDIARQLIRGCNPDIIIEAMANIHTYWPKVNSKSATFITVDLKAMLQKKQIPMDTSILSVVFDSYTKIKTSNKWRDVPEDDLPVNSDDVDCIWAYLSSLIKITCAWIHEKREPRVEGSQLTYGKPDFMKEVDVDKYQSMFGFHL
jgi:hypothetical protein